MTPFTHRKSVMRNSSRTLASTGIVFSFQKESKEVPNEDETK